MEFSVIRATHLRLTPLDECGDRVSGDPILTSGFVGVDQAPVYDVGDEIVLYDSDGEVVVEWTPPGQLVHIDLTIRLCQIDPVAIEYMTGSPRVSTGPGNMLVGGRRRPGFTLELWDGATGGCSGAGEARYPRWVFPWVKDGRLGSITHEYGTQTWEVTGRTSAKPGFGTGPWGDWPELGDRTHGAYEYGTVAPYLPTSEDVEGALLTEGGAVLLTEDGRPIILESV